MKQTEWVFEVRVKITVNGEPIRDDQGNPLTPKTFSSMENYDDCYAQIERFIKRRTGPDDQIVKDILYTREKEYPVTEPKY